MLLPLLGQQNDRANPIGDFHSRASAWRRTASSHCWTWMAVAMAVVAFVARLVPMLRGGGLAGSDGYDDSVYYAAATALVHGRAPYDQFVLLHPPGLILALSPFAALARVTSDSIGQDVARVAFMALGALNTVLVMRLGRRFGVVAGVAAGLLYALSSPAMYAERSTTLEALGTTTLLVALTLLVRPGRSRSWGPVRHTRLLWAGAALGAGAGVKIWGVVPLALLAVWVLVTSGWRAAARLTIAATAAVTAICLPFFLQSPRQMLRYVVLDQLGRPHDGISTIGRLADMTGLGVVLGGAPARAYSLGPVSTTAREIALAVVLALVVAAAAWALTTPGARIFVALLAAQTVLLLTTPSFYLHYATLTAAPGVLVLAVGVARVHRIVSSRSLGRPITRRAGRLVVRLGAGAALVGLAAFAVPGLLRPEGRIFPAALVSSAARVPGCITSDDPTDLIAMNVLSRDLDHGCRVWVDVTGLTYDATSGGGPGQPIHRAGNRTWQREVMSYLLSGSATVVARSGTGLDKASRAAIHALPVIARGPGFILRR